MNSYVIPCLLAVCLPMSGAKGADRLQARLHSPEIAIRRSAIDQIQTLDRAWIPEACLPLLKDEGDSIRRQAARAIGSRFDQIPEDRRAAFLAALRICAKDGPEDVTLIANRAIGLLTGKEASAAFSRSPDGRWVLCEQRRLPVVADRRLRTRQFLSLIHPDSEMISTDEVVHNGELEDVDHPTKLLKLMVTNEPVGDLFEPRWHPKGDALALQPDIQRRYYRPIAIWRARDHAVRTWSVNSFKNVYGNRFPHWATTIDFVKWSGRKAILHIYDADTAEPGAPFDAKGILVSLNIDTWAIGLAKGKN
jgi:hypothetical protein